MIYAAAAAEPLALLFVELGAVVVGLALLARLGHRLYLSAIPLYLIAGLAFGTGGLLPLRFSEEFVRVGAEVGVLLLLFMLGLEYSGDELARNLRSGLPAGAVDLLLNFPPGLIAGFLLGLGWLPAVLLGGVTAISSSGVAAKTLADLGRLNRPETPPVLTVLVLEDLAMAVYLPLVSALLVGGGFAQGAWAVGVALATAAGVLVLAVRFGPVISHFLAHHADEVILLTTLGLVLLVAGLAQRLQVSAAVGAFLVGIAVSGSLAERVHDLLKPLRDLFAAIFFLFFGLQIDPATLPPVLVPALALAVVGVGTKVATGWWAARRAGVAGRGRWVAGAALVARGEFSVVIAGLGAALEPRLGPLTAAYVLLLAVAGPLLMTWTGREPSEDTRGNVPTIAS